jgi:hypothetical protein
LFLTNFDAKLISRSQELISKDQELISKDQERIFTRMERGFTATWGGNAHPHGKKVWQAVRTHEADWFRAFPKVHRE